MSSSDMAEIARLVADQDHEGVVTLTAKLIKAGKTGADIVGSRIAACLQCNKNQEAVEAAGQNKAFAFMKAYALYKLDRLTEAWSTLNNVPADSVDEDSLAHLKAQVLYRQMQYAGAADHYSALMKSLEGGDEAEMWDTQLNLVASLVSAGRGEEVISTASLANAVQHVLDGTAVESSMPFELIYNIACALLDAGRPAAAATALEVALVSGSAMLSEEHGAPPEEVAEETAPLRAQAAMILQQAGYEDAAESLYESMGVTLSGGTRRHLLSGKGSSADPSTRTVAISNLAGLQSNGRKLVEGYARIAAALDASTTSKLTRRQLLTLRFNRALLAFHLKRFTEVETLLTALRTEIPAAKAASAAAEAGMPGYLNRLLDSVEALQVALDAAKAVASGSADAGSVGKVTDLLHKVVQGHKGRKGYISPALASYSQLLQVNGKSSDAANVLLQHSSTPVHPSVSVTCAQLVGPTAEAGLKHLSAAVDTWTAAAAAKPSGPAALAHSSHAVLCAVQALQARASAFATARRWEDAARDLTSIAKKLPGATAQQKAAALAMLALVKIKQSGASAEKETKALLEEARAAVGTGTAATKAGTAGAALSDLEWVVPGVQQQKAKRGADAGASNSRPTGVAPPFGATAMPVAAVDPAAAAAKAAASAKKAEKRRRIARAKRAKRRTAYLAKLSASEKYAMIGIPRPDAERWVPKVERQKGKRRGKDAKGAAGYGHQGGGDAALAAALDAKAKAEKDKASGAPAPSPASPATKGKPAAKGKGRR